MFLMSISSLEKSKIYSPSITDTLFSMREKFMESDAFFTMIGESGSLAFGGSKGTTLL